MLARDIQRALRRLPYLNHLAFTYEPRVCDIVNMFDTPTIPLTLHVLDIDSTSAQIYCTDIFAEHIGRFTLYNATAILL
jgi:hypothetical protein